MSVRKVKEATKSEFETFKKERHAEADLLTKNGYVFRGTGPKSFNPAFARWLPTTDFWSKANTPEGKWVTRQEALASI